MEFILWVELRNFFFTMLCEKCFEKIFRIIKTKREKEQISNNFVDHIKSQMGLKDDSDILSNEGLINYIKYDLRQDILILLAATNEDEEKNRIVNTACNRAHIDNAETKECVSKMISMCIDELIEYYSIQASPADLVNAEHTAKRTVKEIIKKEAQDHLQLVEEMHEKIEAAWNQENNDCPSMRTIPDKSNFDCLVHIEESSWGITKNITLEEAINQSWKQQQSYGRINHISLYGVGGLGKTVSLLKLSISIPKIYVPLRLIAKDKSIEYYIKRNVFKSKENLYTEFVQLCDTTQLNKPSCLLIIDGLNEINDTKHKDSILEELAIYSKCKGLQLLISSRYDALPECRQFSGKMTRFRMCTLSQEQIKSILETSHISIPNLESRVWKIIDTPLMLSLYLCAEKKFTDEYEDLEYTKLYETTSAGAIIWNFLQTEIARYEKAGPEVVETVIILESIAPHIAYNMQQSGQFVLTCSTFKEKIQKAITAFLSDVGKKALPKRISDIMETSEKGAENIQKDHIYKMLTKQICLFVKSGNTVQFMHQHFRDALSAVYIYQTVRPDTTMIPDAWKKMTEKGDQYVLSFLSDYLHTDTQHIVWNTIWGLMRNNVVYNGATVDPLFIQMMLKLYKQSYDEGDIKLINFSGLDLSNVSLLRYHLNNCCADHFDCTVIGQKTILGDDHSMKISSISWSQDGKRFLSASHDTSLRIWDDKSRNIINIGNPHGHYIRCAQWNPYNQSLIASAGDDMDLIVWKKDSDKWKYESLGKTKDWIYSLSWDSTGKQIACSDRSGNVYSFSLSYEEFRYQQHPNEAKCVSCSREWLFATGDIDGNVYIREFKRFDPRIILNFKKMIIAVQWTSNKKIVVVTSEGFWYVDCGKLIDNKITEWHQDDTDGLLWKESFPGISAAAIGSINGTDYFAFFANSSLTAYKGIYNNGDFSLATIDKIDLYSQESSIVSCAVWNEECNKLLFGSSNGSILEAELYQEESTFDRFAIKIISDGNPNSARCSTWNTEGTLLAVGYDDGNIRIWNIEKQRCEKILKGHINSVKCLNWEPSPMSKRLVSGSDDGCVIIWDLDKDNKEKILGKNLSQVNCVLWNDDQTVVCGTDNNGLYVWDLQSVTTDPIDYKLNTRIYGVLRIPESNTFISAGNDMNLYLWNPDMSKKKINIIQKINSEHTKAIRGLTWIPEKKGIISASNDGNLIFREYETEKNQLSNNKTVLPPHHKDFIYHVTTTENGKYIITGSTDTTIGIWATHDFSFVKQLCEHKSFIWNVSSHNINNSSCYLASSSSDGTTKIWDVTDIDPTKELNSIASFPVLPGMELVDCDFSKATITDSELKSLIALNGGIVTTDEIDM